MKTQFELNELKVKYMPNKYNQLTEKVISSESAYNFLLKSYDMDTIGCQEQCNVLYLNNANYPIGIYKASIGGITGTVIDTKLIIGLAIKTLASGIIISHNHPSGNLTPSNNDYVITKKLKEACSYFDIKLLDHLILSPYGSKYSFADNFEL
jgi:DNA repair protein RadC